MKTNETLKVTCNQCGEQKSGSIEGICEHCGRFGNLKNQKFQRYNALMWWNSLNYSTRRRLTYHLDRSSESDPAIWANEEEIEEIWRKETQSNRDAIEMIKSINDNWDMLSKQPQATVKPNQKQFKQFDPKLFKSYIEKFRPSDRVLAKIILEDRIKQWEEKGQ